ncbi:hypothetical protein MMC07_003989 [Pseudocyphellaria aurata]|nr:hypothetical protein [Pseudocyphellaria aurata]
MESSVVGILAKCEIAHRNIRGLRGGPLHAAALHPPASLTAILTPLYLMKLMIDTVSMKHEQEQEREQRTLFTFSLLRSMSFNNTNTDILVAGAFAAFTVDLLVYPLDTIKTRIQSPDYKRLYTNSSTGAINRALFRGLYQGLLSVVIATVPSSGAFFTTYEGTKSLLYRLNPTLSHQTSSLLPSPLIHAIASSIAELVSCLILTPAEVLKQNAQMVTKSAGHSKSSGATVVTLRKFRKQPSQLWRGYTALAGRNLPFTAMQFPLFEQLRSTIHDYRHRHGLSSGTMLETGAVTAISAGTAGSLAAVITTPIDVIKTRIMLSASGPKADTQTQAEHAKVERAQQAARGGRAGGYAVGKEILRSEGVKGLFRGGALRGLWTCAGSGLYLGAYESGRRYLEERRLGAGEGQGIS